MHSVPPRVSVPASEPARPVSAVRFDVFYGEPRHALSALTGAVITLFCVGASLAAALFFLQLSDIKGFVETNLIDQAEAPVRQVGRRFGGDRLPVARVVVHQAPKHAGRSRDRCLCRHHFARDAGVRFAALYFVTMFLPTKSCSVSRSRPSSACSSSRRFAGHTAPSPDYVSWGLPPGWGCAPTER